MDDEDIKKLALAIAKANRHPNPEWWAERVVTVYTGGTLEEDLVVEEPAPGDAPTEG